MARDDENRGKDGKAPSRQYPQLSDESIERAKHELLFGSGYKRPPRHARFRKGRSGNPRGRPKKHNPGMGDVRSADALVLNQAGRPVAVREGEEVKEISAIEAVLRAMCASAVKGNSHAQRHFIERYDRAERARRRRIEEKIAIWRYYVSAQREAIAKAERNGETPPEPLPHPDDVALDEETGVRFIGPVCEEDLRQIEETCRMRDALIMQDGLDDRLWEDPESDDPLDGPGTALLFARVFNQAVPERFRLGEGEIIRRTMRYERISKRQLLKDVYQGWRALGVHIRRGRTFPPLRAGKARLELMFDLVQRAKDGRLDVLGSTTEELAAEIEAVVLERQNYNI